MDSIAAQGSFDEIMQVSGPNSEFWSARDLMPLLGYDQWRNFENVINKAKEACENSGHPIATNFADISKVSSGSGPSAKDYLLTRYACYLIAQNGDSGKPQVAQAQTYFAVQTRKQELLESMSEDEKRVTLRQNVRSYNKRLQHAAKDAGVNNFPQLNNAGYLGMYKMTAAQIKEHKGIKDDFLDRAGPDELAANAFRITQTEEKLRREEIQGQFKADLAHQEVGGIVRKAIAEAGNTMPEHMKPQEHIKKVEKRIKTSGLKPAQLTHDNESTNS